MKNAYGSRFGRGPRCVASMAPRVRRMVERPSVGARLLDFIQAALGLMADGLVAAFGGAAFFGDKS